MAMETLQELPALNVPQSAGAVSTGGQNLQGDKKTHTRTGYQKNIGLTRVWVILTLDYAHAN